MAIKSNNSNEEVMNSIKNYSGISNFNVMAVNPTMEELHSMDIKVKTEPDYFLELNGEDYFKVVFWVKNQDLTTRLEILMQNKHRTSKTGKFQWLNAVGQGTWSEDNPTYDWWQKPETSRKAFGGEETLINFVKAWANVAPGDNVYFDTIDKIVAGDVKELKELVTNNTKIETVKIIPVEESILYPPDKNLLLASVKVSKPFLINNRIELYMINQTGYKLQWEE